MYRLRILAAILLCLCLVPATTNASIVFSNIFEDGNSTPELGTMTFNNAGPTDSLVTVSANPDPILDSTVYLMDQGNAVPLDLSLNFADATNTYACLDLTNGNTVNLSFDVAARRINGIAKTHYIKAVDTAGNTVMEFVLGDAGAFGNGGNDRQRPGSRDSSGSTFLPGAGNFFWGADTSPATFDVIRDAHFDITIGANGWDIDYTHQNGNTLSTSLPTFDGSSFTDIASFEISSNGTNYGMYWDNIVVDATAPVVDAAAHVIPEPSSATLLLIAALGMVTRRKRQS